MSEDSDLERTEEASPQRLERAREEGDVPRSRELATTAVLVAAGFGLLMFGPHIFKQLSGVMTKGMSFERVAAFDFNFLSQQLWQMVIDAFLAIAPLVAMIIIAALAAPMLIGGWLFTFNALQPKFSRMNPISGLANMFSRNAGVELVKAILKTLLVGIIAVIVILKQKENIIGLFYESVENGVSHTGTMLTTSFLLMVSGLVIIALIDAPYQVWSYAQKLKMTHQEVIQEHKEANGNPQIKAKIRQQQRDMARRRMMQEIPTADVVITNPTHFAVALKYTEGKNVAPQVVAKGADEVAAKIREIAKEHQVTMLEAPPLARALYKHAELGDEIPQALYAAVAEVLAYVFQLRTYQKTGGRINGMQGQKMAKPIAPKKIAVPAGYDFLETPPHNPSLETEGNQ